MLYYIKRIDTREHLYVTPEGIDTRTLDDTRIYHDENIDTAHAWCKSQNDKKNSSKVYDVIRFR